jgi:hypothetical protein
MRGLQTGSPMLQHPGERLQINSPATIVAGLLCYMNTDAY